MKLTQENICRVLQSAPEKGATTREILSALAQKKKRSAQLRKILKELLRNKICFKSNNRYHLQPQSTTSASANKPSRTQAHSKGGKRSNPKGLLGLVVYQGREQSIYRFDKNTQYKLASASRDILLHGDLASFSLQKNRSGDEEATINELVERRITCLKGMIHAEKKGRLVFIPDHAQGPRQYTVLNSVPLKKDQQAEAWLDISKFSLNQHRAEGKVRLFPEGMPGKSPLLQDILDNNNIPVRFPEKVLAACQTLPASVRFDKKSDRVDLRDLPFVTIDGEDAKDFDDAIYAEKEGNHFRIWVSIADVAEYVPAGSVFDQEAFARGTSTYLPGKVYPMLPEPLSNGLCSLKEGLNRKTLTCESLIDNKGKTLSSRIYTSFNRMACRLTYTGVDRFYETGVIQQRKSFPHLAEHLLLYREISQILRQKRLRSGFIDFQLPETRFEYDKQDRIIDLLKSYQSVAMQVIEQLMLLANENVAKFCDQHKLPIVWRNHPQPLPEKLKRLRKLLWNSQVQVSDLKTGKDFNRAMAQIKENPDKDFLENAMLRSMSLAVYETNRGGHFGIAADYYCHFTSPIRRYPDLLVHRALKTYLRGHQAVRIPEYVAVTASERERMATSAERSANRFFKLFFLADKIGQFFEAKISGFINAGIFVEIDFPYAEGFLAFATIYDDHYEFDEELQCIWGRTHKTRFTIGKKLRVLLTRLDWGNLSPEFDWICWKEEV